MNNDDRAEKEKRSFGALLSSLSRDAVALVSNETELAKTEMSGKVSQAMSGLVSLIIAAVVALGGFIILLEAAVYGLNRALPPRLTPWLSALIVGLVAIVIGLILLQKGRSNLKANNLLPEKTINSVKRDEAFAEEQVT